MKTEIYSVLYSLIFASDVERIGASSQSRAFIHSHIWNSKHSIISGTFGFFNKAYVTKKNFLAILWIYVMNWSGPARPDQARLGRVSFLTGYPSDCSTDTSLKFQHNLNTGSKFVVLKFKLKVSISFYFIAFLV